MNTLLWILVGVLAYSAVAVALQTRGYLPRSVRLQGPLTTVHTKRGRAFLNWLARPKRFWRAWSNVGVGIALVVMVGSFFLLILAALSALQTTQPSAVSQPRNFLVIPGVNDFLPLSVAPEIVFGLLVGLVVHEGGHGLLCRVEDIDIESMWIVLLTILPIGAFVEPNEESQKQADRGGKTRMFAAGVMNNFAITAIVFALLFGPVIGSIGLAPGVGVGAAYGPAADADIGQGDRITAINGTEVSSNEELLATLEETGGSQVAVEINGERTAVVERSPVVVASTEGNPANLSVDPDADDPITVQSVNGTPVNTMSEFRTAVEDREFAVLGTSEGERRTPIGTLAQISEARPLADQTDLAPGDTVTITRIDDQRIVDAGDLTRTLDGYQPDDEVTLRLYTDGAFRTVTVTLDEDGFVGVSPAAGVSGLTLTDFGVQHYPAATYLALLGGEGGDGSLDGVPLAGAADSFLGLIYVALILPLASVVLGLPYNFPGFTGFWTNFFVVEGPLAFLGGGVFLLANLLFWTGWINLQLGLFNCIPGYPLDGGRILRTSAEAVVSRLPVGDRYTLVRTITTGVGLTMLVALVLTVFGPSLLN
jgi:membrane-associated protease RseP (regulator of RpoE activity)